jgi:hypothetical protein
MENIIVHCMFSSVIAHVEKRFKNVRNAMLRQNISLHGFGRSVQFMRGFVLYTS